MGFEAVRIAIESRLKDNLLSSVPIKFDNVPFNYPSKKTSYVALVILTGEGFQIAMSPKRYRHVGIITGQIFAPEDKGTKEANEIADFIKEIFQGIQFSGITCRAANTVRVGEIEGKFQINVNIPFFWDETGT